MVAIARLQTLVRMGTYEKKLSEAIRDCSERLVPFHWLNKRLNGYCLLKECPGEREYLLIAIQEEGTANPNAEVYTTLAVTSYSEEKNLRVAEQFERETGIPLNQLDNLSHLEDDIDFLLTTKLKQIAETANSLFRFLEERPHLARRLQN